MTTTKNPWRPMLASRWRGGVEFDARGERSGRQFGWFATGRGVPEVGRIHWGLGGRWLARWDCWRLWRRYRCPARGCGRLIVLPPLDAPPGPTPPESDR